jgi:DNA polymerase-3 subunit delta'
MGIERFPWLNDSIVAYKNLAFSSSSIIEGEQGLAKKQLAKYFAQKLLCTNEAAPCGTCNSCNYFLAGSHPDYCFLDQDSCSSVLHTYSKAKKDTLTANKIEGIRALNEFIAMTNSVSAKRVAIVFDAHSMNINAQNALLKTLEELPENKHIFLISNQRKYFLPTIYSRSNLVTIKNPDPNDLDQWITDQGYIDFSSLNFAPDSTPLQIEQLINNDLAGQYTDISENLNSYCLGKKTTPDLLKFYKEMNISFDEKINSIILFLKTCIGINQDFYKSHPIITSPENMDFDTMQASDLIEELVDYKYQLNKVSSLNEQIGLNNFFYKIKNLFS